MNFREVFLGTAPAGRPREGDEHGGDVEVHYRGGKGVVVVDVESVA